MSKIERKEIISDTCDLFPYNKYTKEHLTQTIELIERFVITTNIYLFIIKNQRHISILKDTDIFVSINQPFNVIFTYYESYKDIFNYIVTAITISSGDFSEIELNTYKKQFSDFFNNYHVEYLKICKELKETRVVTTDDTKNIYFNELTTKLCMLAPHLSVLNIKDLLHFYISNRKIQEFMKICVAKLDHKNKNYDIKEKGLINSVLHTNSNLIENIIKKDRAETREYIIKLITEIKCNIDRTETPTFFISSFLSKLRDYAFISAESEHLINRFCNNMKNTLLSRWKNELIVAPNTLSLKNFEKHELQFELRESIKYLLLSTSKQLHVNIFVFLSSFDESNMITSLTDLNLSSLVKYIDRIELSAAAAHRWLNLSKSSENKTLISELAFCLANKPNSEKTNFNVKDRYEFIKISLDNYMLVQPKAQDPDYEIRKSTIRRQRDALYLQFQCQRELRERLKNKQALNVPDEFNPLEINIKINALNELAFDSDDIFNEFVEKCYIWKAYLLFNLHHKNQDSNKILFWINNIITYCSIIDAANWPANFICSFDDILNNGLNTKFINWSEVLDQIETANYKISRFNDIIDNISEEGVWERIVLQKTYHLKKADGILIPTNNSIELQQIDDPFWLVDYFIKNPHLPSLNQLYLNYIPVFQKMCNNEELREEHTYFFRISYTFMMIISEWIQKIISLISDDSKASLARYDRNLFTDPNILDFKRAFRKIIGFLDTIHKLYDANCEKFESDKVFDLLKNLSDKIKDGEEQFIAWLETGDNEAKLERQENLKFNFSSKK